MGKYCDHDFFNIKLDVDYSSPSTTQGTYPINYTAHAVVGCIYCGQIRKIYADGRVIIEIEEGIIERKRNGTSSNNINHQSK